MEIENPNKVSQAAHKLAWEAKNMLEDSGYDWFWQGQKFRPVSDEDYKELRNMIYTWMRDKRK